MMKDSNTISFNGMTQEDNELLLKDLCARLPYGVIVNIDGYRIGQLKGIDGDIISTDNGINYPLRLVKPYLRPLSSMTEEEKLEFSLAPIYASAHYNEIAKMDWLKAHHFDFRGLIEKDAAIAVTEDNNPYKD